MALTTVDSGLLSSGAQYTGFKNRIINGDMKIDQRNAGASGTTAGAYTIDRWNYVAAQSSKGTWQQNAGAVTPPSGFVNYLGFTSSSAYSVLSGDTFLFSQAIEGLNIADLGWGTVNASTVTLSFWARSSLTGTFGGSLNNYNGSRSYVFSYTISVANTWEFKTITVTGDTSGTWRTNNEAGIVVRFGLGSGSTYSGTSNTWQAGNIVQPTGSVSVVSTNGATFYITGVQLEKGSTATSFDYRPYGIEEVLCKRYFQTLRSISGWAGVTNMLWVHPCWDIPMRATPTWGQTGLLSLTEPGVTGPWQSGPGLTQAGGVSPTSGFYMINNLTTTAGRVYMTNDSYNYITLSAEL